MDAVSESHDSDHEGECCHASWKMFELLQHAGRIYRSDGSLEICTNTIHLTQFVSSRRPPWSVLDLGLGCGPWGEGEKGGGGILAFSGASQDLGRFWALLSVTQKRAATSAASAMQ